MGYSIAELAGFYGREFIAERSCATTVYTPDTEMELMQMFDYFVGALKYYF